MIYHVLKVFLTNELIGNVLILDFLKGEVHQKIIFWYVKVHIK